MNRSALEKAAEERLLDAALTEVLGDGATRVAAPAVRRGPRWLIAAILPLGIGVLLAVALLVSRRDGAFAQDPELPPAIKVEGREALATLDRTTKNLWCVLTPRDVPLLAEFGELRQLLLEQQMPLRKPDMVMNESDATPWSLAPLARCAHLRSLTIGNLEGFAAKALDAVARLPELTELKLIGVHHLVDAAFAGVIQKLPVRTLSLLAVGVDAPGFNALCGLPLLERLELDSCLHLDRCDLMQLRHLRQLRALTLHGVGSRFADSLSKSHPLADEPRLEPPPDPPGVFRSGLQMPGEPRLLLTPALMQALAKLPELRELSLSASVVDDAVLAALPLELTALDLSDCVGLGTQGLAAPPALRELQRFEFTDLDGSATALWRFVRSHRLRELSFHGPLTEAALAGLSTQSELRALELVLHGQPAALDVAFVSALPQLERLSIVFAPDFDPAPLTHLQHLRRVELHQARPATVARVRHALGDRASVLAIDD